MFARAQLVIFTLSLIAASAALAHADCGSSDETTTAVTSLKANVARITSKIPDSTGPQEFNKLYRALGFSDSYFGATDDQLQSLDNYTNQGDSFFDEINDYL